VAKAEGIRFWDVRGKEYLDGLAGVYVVNVGYGNPPMLEAVRRQPETLPFNPPMHATNPRAVELASLLAEVAPGDLNTARLVDSGSEANEAAFKMARQYHRQTGNPGKYKILSRYLSYHGATGSAMSAGGVGYRKTLYEPAAVGFLHTYPLLLPLSLREDPSELRGVLRPDTPEHDRVGGPAVHCGDHRGADQ